MQKKSQFSGVIAPVLTPFGEDGGPDAERFVEHCQWLMAEGCTGLSAVRNHERRQLARAR
jgi:4-hydroxy-tetrahydrodipicolinate synthase